MRQVAQGYILPMAGIVPDLTWFPNYSNIFMGIEEPCVFKVGLVRLIIILSAIFNLDLLSQCKISKSFTLILWPEFKKWRKT